jgi:hypothetical protein
MIQTVAIITVIMAVVCGGIVGVFLLRRIFAEIDGKFSQLVELFGENSKTLTEYDMRLKAAEETGGQRLIRDTLTKYEESLHKTRLLENDIKAIQERIDNLSAREARRVRDEGRKLRREKREEQEEEQVVEQEQEQIGPDREQIPEHMIHPAFRQNYQQQQQQEQPRRKFGTLSA